MRIAKIVDVTEAEGPGRRFALWVQGCARKCPGCYAREFQAADGGREIAAEEVLRRIYSVSDQIEGITLLGGEPMERASDLVEMLSGVHRKHLSVITFTGFCYEDLLNSGTDAQKELLKYTDVLIDGPYIETQRDLSRPLVGSANQRFLFLTERYGPKDFEKKPNRIEIRVGPDGAARINGMGDFPALERMLQEEGWRKGRA